MSIKLSDYEKETMSYDDVAFIILTENKKKCKIQDLFKKVIKAMSLPESTFEDEIGDFFELIITDKRFIMLENGYCDLKINHSAKVIIDEDDEEDLELSAIDNELTEEIEDNEDNYDENANPDDDAEDDLQDLVIIDENDENESDML